MRCIEPLIELDQTLSFTFESQINKRRKIYEVRFIIYFDCFWGLEIDEIDLENLGFFVVTEKLPACFIQL
jgi:hypothetical protein